MSRESDWVVASLKKIADRQIKNMGGELKKPLPVGPQEQMRRFLNGAEFERVLSGEISPTEYADYQRAMLKQLGALRR